MFIELEALLPLLLAVVLQRYSSRGISIEFTQFSVSQVGLLLFLSPKE